ncbi:hypothetical protein A2853_01780 [Candidatus Kaiserbacteria bacterium RIFCSPHIGHO2_01_FULL_55_17]|uniref:LamG-like jellyroll fold domain-containing protein n=1 Tax=Candidatus Kaiserbacteria bacterium RIFCSPHIGHO2_01_FULL_55_17 TaxID=1798484 RepID=A0A1F6D8C8_9BACT|nr:MAG: hypothetical protein A2853_01780 [Candidatus Kaiserbacteria bacterium RIFCSPHIGHO2_01_FULL_55_17]
MQRGDALLARRRLAAPFSHSSLFLPLLPFLLLASLLVFLPSPSFAATIGRINSNNLGLVGYWTFDGPDLLQNAKDRSGQGNNGYLASFTSTTTVPGKIGQALKFDGSDDYIDLGETGGDVLERNDITISLWFKPVAVMGDLDGLISKSASAPFQFGIRIRSGGSDIQVYTNSSDLNSGYTPVVGEWQLVTATLSSAAVRKIYINGELKNQDNQALPYFTDNQDKLYIGLDFAPGQGREFNGTIDDVRVYNRALSATEVAALYKSGSTNVAHSNAGAIAPLSNGLVGHWTFDGGATNWGTGKTNDLSGQGNTGQLINMSTTSSPVAGKIGQALNFNGASSHIKVADDANGNLDATGDFSYSLWYKLRSITDNDTFFTKGSGGLQLVLNIADGYNLCKEDVSCFFVGKGPAVSPNTWEHVTVTRSGTTLHLYKNGAEITPAVSNATTINDTSDFLWIGMDYSSIRHLDGLIDDVRIYNRALSATEVAALYKSGSTNVAHTNTGPNAPLTSALVGHWTFDGGTTNWGANTTNDVSGNGNTGTLVSMSTTTSPTPGKIGQALKFDGSSQYANVGAGSTQPSLPLTASAWIKSNSLAATQGIIGNHSAPTTHVGYWMEISTNGTLNLSYGDNTNCGSPNRRTKSSAAAVTAGKWYHVVGVIKGATDMNIYINGVDAGGTYTGSGGSITYSGATTVGASGTAIGQPCAAADFNGVIDDARIYNRALSAQEVLQLYNMSR